LRRVEVTDTVHVEADDPSGISQLGYEVRSTPGGPIDDSSTFVSNGQLTFQPHTFTMKLPYTNFPTTEYLQVAGLDPHHGTFGERRTRRDLDPFLIRHSIPSR